MLELKLPPTNRLETARPGVIRRSALIASKKALSRRAMIKSSYMPRQSDDWHKNEHIGSMVCCLPLQRHLCSTGSIDDVNPQELLTYIIQYCLFPRAILSPMDADFAAQFIKVLHNVGTKGFWTMGCYNKLLGANLGSVVFSFTQNEARNYGKSRVVQSL